MTYNVVGGTLNLTQSNLDSFSIFASLVKFSSLLFGSFREAIHGGTINELRSYMTDLSPCIELCKLEIRCQRRIFNGDLIINELQQ